MKINDIPIMCISSSLKLSVCLIFKHLNKSLLILAAQTFTLYLKEYTFILFTNLSQGLSVRAHVCKNDKHMFLALVGQELSCGQGNTWSNDTLNTVTDKTNKSLTVNNLFFADTLFREKSVFRPFRVFFIAGSILRC